MHAFYSQVYAANGLACSAVATTVLSTGSWPDTLGTVAVSVITLSSSIMAALVLGELASKTAQPFCSQDAALVIEAIATSVSFVAINTLALGVITWAGLPVAALSLEARVAVSAIAGAPLALYNLGRYVFFTNPYEINYNNF